MWSSGPGQSELDWLELGRILLLAFRDPTIVDKPLHRVVIIQLDIVISQDCYLPQLLEVVLLRSHSHSPTYIYHFVYYAYR